MWVCLKKGRDGPSTLSVVRADGTATWGKVHPFLPLHDLAHYAVESMLGYREAFFGLIGSGWELDDFAGPGAGSRLPAEALWAEHLVGLLDRERAAGRPATAAELDEQLALSLAGREAPPPLAEATLVRIRQLKDRLAREWLALAPGDTLRLGFPAPEAGADGSR
jgi:hypothetical protein